MTDLVRAVPKPRKRAKRRGHASPVTPALRQDVFQRDGYRCMAPVLDPATSPSSCADRYGRPAVIAITPLGPTYRIDALTIEHVNEVARLGKRAPSDPEHTLTLCHHHNVDGWAATHREEERAHLRQLYGDTD